MKRQHATTWLVAIFVLALGAMGMVRDLHAADHASSDGHHAVCASEHADTTPASLPIDSSDDEPDCPTCDLLAVLAKGVVTQTAAVVAEPAPASATINEAASTNPVVAEFVNANRTRGPPAVLRCAV